MQVPDEMYFWLDLFCFFRLVTSVIMSYSLFSPDGAARPQSSHLERRELALASLMINGLSISRNPSCQKMTGTWGAVDTAPLC
jgi:hypothetical protein